MKRELSRKLGFLVALSLLLNISAPSALAAPSSRAPTAYTALFPAWYAPQSATLTITKSATPDPVDQGALITYIITVTNSSAEEAQQVIVTDTTPAGTVFESANVIDGGGATWFWGGLSTGESGEFVWFTSDRIFPDDGGLPANATAVLQFVVRVVGPFPDQGLVYNDAYYADAANANLVQGPTVTTTVNAPAFALGKTATPDPVAAGERLTYTIYLTNTGHLATTRPYTIVETLPGWVTYADSSPPAQVAGGVLTWTLTTPLAVGGATSVTFAVTVTAPLTDGFPLVNDEYIAFSEEVTPTATGPAITTTVHSSPLLAIAKADEPDPTVSGGTIRYTIVVTNEDTANGPAQGLVVTDRVPLSTTLVTPVPGATWSGTTPGSLITWTLPSYLWPGEVVTLHFTVTVASPMVSGTLILNGDYGATADNAPAPVLGDLVTTTVQSFPDLHLVKTADPTLLSPGDWVTFTLVFTNEGTTGASGIVVTDTLPVSLTNVLSTTTPNVTLAGATHPYYTWTVSPLAPGQGGAITIAAQVMTTTAWGQSTVLINRARISTADTDVDPTNNGDEAAVTVVPGPAAQVLVTAAPSSLSVDCSATVTATVLDAWGNPVADGTTVTFTTSTATSAVAPATAGTSNGRASTTLTSIRPGLVVVTATVGTGVSDTTTVNFAPGAPTTFLFAPVGDQVAGVSFLTTLTATDQYGNVATGFTGQVDLSDATGTLSPTTAGPAVGGVITQMVTITRAWVGDRITATARVTPTCGVPYWATGSSNPFTVTHSAPVTASLSPAWATVQAGATLAYTTVATDAYGNEWDATSEATYTASGGNSFLGTPPGNNVFSATVVGTDLPVTATVDGVQAVAYVTVTHGAAAQLSIRPPVTTVVAGSWVTYTAVATDGFGNAWDATGETAWSAGGGNVFVGNVLSATVAGTWAVTGTLGSVQDTGTITVTPGPADHLVFAPIGTQTAGVGFTVVITAVDRFGNVATGFASTVSLTDATGTLDPTSWSGWTDGVASFTAVVTRAWTGDRITATVVATPTVWGASNPFDVVGGAPATLDYQTPPTMAICSQAPVTVTVLDEWGNPVPDGTPVTLTASSGLYFVESGRETYATTTQDGQVTASLVAGSASGAWESTEACAGSVCSTRWIQITTPGSPASIALQAAPTTLPVGGTSALTATVYDCAANPVADGTLVDFAVAPPLGTVAPDPAATSGGTATATFTAGPTAGTVVVSATVGERVATTTLHLVSGEAYTVVLQAEPTTLVADGVSTATLTVTATDAYGNPVADGTLVDFAVAPPLGTVAPDPAATSGGTATATFTAGPTAGTVVVSATVGERVATTTLHLVAGGVHTVVLRAEPTTLVADGVSTATLTVTATDAYGNPVADGTAVDFAVAPPLGTVAPDPATTSGGTAVAVFTAGTTTGTVRITATVGGHSDAVTLTLVPLPRHFVYLPLVVHNYGPNLVVESLVVEPASPRAGEPFWVTVTVRNAGTAPVGPFWVDLYLDPDRAPEPGVPWNAVSDEGVAWRVDGLDPGETAVLRSDQGTPGYTFWRGTLGATPDPHILYAVVDSWPYYPLETVAESREDDNVYGPVEVPIGR